ncbi:MAG: DUF3500 domain-containing protein [Pseudomonadota bacterium]
MKNSLAFRCWSLALLLCTGAAQATPTACENPGGGELEPVLAAVARLHSALTAPQLALLERPLTRENATRWSNLPVGVVPRAGLRLGDLDEKQAAAARAVFETALSPCGLKMLDDVRHADDFLIPLDARPIGWDGRNYYLSVLGQPSAHKPWMLQLGGHHLAYNFTFNARKPGATPLFFGTEPIRFELQGVSYEPLKVQSTSMRNLAVAIAGYSQAKLSGTFTDVVKGVEVTPVPGQLPKGGTDTGFPQTYPAGTNDRGVPYSALNPAEQALVRTALRSYASLPGAAVSQPLLAAYESSDALRETYVGYAGATDLGEKGSYVRIDGPRIWMEFVVQPAVAKPSENHYHALWRDKQSDYGGEVGH